VKKSKRSSDDSDLDSEACDFSETINCQKGSNGQYINIETVDKKMGRAQRIRYD
jgi:hypothetical protein